MLRSCVLSSAAGPHTVINGKEVVNFASANYLGLIGHEKLLVRETIFFLLLSIIVTIMVVIVIVVFTLGVNGNIVSQESCTSALEKYGVGSCGPRGFYGTIGIILFPLFDQST